MMISETFFATMLNDNCTHTVSNFNFFDCCSYCSSLHLIFWFIGSWQELR